MGILSMHIQNHIPQNLNQFTDNMCHLFQLITQSLLFSTDAFFMSYILLLLAILPFFNSVRLIKNCIIEQVTDKSWQATCRGVFPSESC